MQDTIIILCGKRNPSIIAGNIYKKLLGPSYQLLFIEERRKKEETLQFFKNYLKKRGLLRTLDVICFRIYFILISIFKKTTESLLIKEYVPDLIVSNVNEKKVLKLVEKYSPKYIITNGCWILNEHTLNHISCPIINLHMGIAPRYRGSGNIYAFYENNFKMVGVTIHYVDKGIDTGKPISIIPIDIKKDNFPMKDIALVSFEKGAHAIVEFILKNTKEIPDAFRNLASHYYPLPGLTHYLQARRNYKNYINK